MNTFFMAALAPTTRATYRSGLKAYRLFCGQMGFPLFPLEQYILQLFVTALALRLSFATIKVYLSGIQYESRILGFHESISSMNKLFYVLRGIKRTQGSKWLRKKRKPITPVHLRHMLDFIHNSLFTAHDKAMWKCLVLVAFFGLMRVSEYVCPSSTSFDPTIHLSVRDFQLSSCGKSVAINIKASKTDPFRAGIQIRLVAIGNLFCPVMAVTQYLRLTGSRSGPCFVLSHGDFVTRKYVSAFVRISLPQCIDLDTHSFRIGGASAAASCGVPDSVIKILGRWSSDCYRRYLRISDNVIKDCLLKVSCLDNTNKIWDIDSI